MSAVFPTYARWEVTVKEGKGTKIIDIDNKEYLDFTSGIGVCNLGHCHEGVVNALKEQADKLWHVSNLFQIPLQEEVASLLTKYSCGDYVFFCNSGAEANEGAIKLARKYTQKTKIITFKQSFHGRTFASMSATGQEKVHTGFGPLLQQFEYATFNDIESVKQLIDDNVAAIMFEVIQGEGGVHVGNQQFIQDVANLCKEQNILLIVDEVQTGIGRTGKPFAYQHYDIEPDIITVAKGLGNGFPVGAIIGKEKLKETFGLGSHGSTFGGTPLAMAVVKETLQQVFTTNLGEEVIEKGELLLSTLQDRLANNDSVVSVRGKGLMIGIEYKSEVAPIMAKLRKQGLLVLNAGPNVLRLLPPLTVTKEEIFQAVDMICGEL